jgi:hypothetical protein
MVLRGGGEGVLGWNGCVEAVFAIETDEHHGYVEF